MANEKHKKHWTTVLQDIWYNSLCGLWFGMTIVGFWFMGMLIVFLVTDGNASNWWCQVAVAIASTLLTLGILRYLGRGGK